MKKLTALLLTAVLSIGLLAGCGSKEADASTVKVGASPVPHAQILEVVKEELAKQDITLEIVEFTDYIQPNEAVESGDIDANYFQHITYMDAFNADHGTHLVSLGAIHYEPFGIYAGTSDSLTALPQGAKIGIPNDPTNGGRALLLLQEQGLITLPADCGLEPKVLDIVEDNGYKIVEMEAAQLPLSLDSLDLAVINGNYAIQAGLDVSSALAIEAADGIAGTAYANVLSVKEGNEENPNLTALLAALQSEAVKDYIAENYDGAVVPTF